MDWITVHHCCCFMAVIIQTCAQENKVLMLMKRGDGSNFHTLWNAQGGVNDFVNKSLQSNWDIIRNGTFRSAEVDDWKPNCPAYVSIEALNWLGDVMWFATFEPAGASNDPLVWLTEDKIVEATQADLPTVANKKIYHQFNDSMILIAQSSNTNVAWLSVGTNGSTAPDIKFVRNTTMPLSLTSTYSGWWSGSIWQTLGTSGMEFLMDLSGESDSQNSHIFLRRQVVQVVKFLIIFDDNRYQFYYSPFPCGQGNLTAYVDETGTIKTFIAKAFPYDIDTIAVWCMKIVLLDPVQSGYTVKFWGTAKTDNFIDADALSVVGHYYPDNCTNVVQETTTVFESTSAPSTTTTTTTSEPTTASTTTASTTTASTTTKSTTSTTSSTTSTITSAPSTVTTEGGQIVTTDEITTMTPSTTSSLISTHLNPPSTSSATTGSDSTPTTVTTSSTESTVTTSTVAPQSASPNALCQCPCTSEMVNMTTEELKEAIQELRKELIVNKTSLSSFQRKLFCAKDDRLSARSLGYVGVIVISIIVGGLVFLDISTFSTIFKNARHKIFATDI